MNKPRSIRIHQSLVKVQREVDKEFEHMNEAVAESKHEIFREISVQVARIKALVKQL